MTDPFDFSGQSVVVTGGATGIGEACCQLFAERGARVTIMDINRDGAERVAGDIRAAGGAADVQIVDLTDYEATVKAVGETHARTGRIDVLVHSAGGFPKYVGLIDCPPEQWDLVINSNLKSLFYLLKATAPLMIAAKYGRIVVLSSAAVRAIPIVSAPHYAAAKAGEIGLTQQAAKALGPHGITANAVAPGFVSTPRTDAMRTPEMVKKFEAMIPVGRICPPIEIAWPILFLATRQSGYITGATIDINGGAAMI